MKSLLRHLVALWLLVIAASVYAAQQNPLGFLVAAPDRGFMGNEEIREQFEVFAAKHNAALVHVTDERTRATAQAAVAALAKKGARRIVVLPLFYTRDEARHAVLRKALEDTQPLPVEWAAHFGASYFAVEALADRLRALPASQERRLLLAGTGAVDAAGAERMSAELRRIAQKAAEGLSFTAVDAVVWPEPRTAAEESLREQAQDKLAQPSGAIVAPVHLGRKLDSMMAFSNTLRRAVAKDSRLLPEETLTPLALMWMQREANRRLPLAADQIGVVIAAHGSDWHWNETIRSALRGLERRHKVEYAFSMADAPVLERAVRRLDQRGARAIVIVRVFGMQESFQPEIERLIGRDVEGHDAHEPQAAQHDHGHGDHAAMVASVQRIRSAAVLLTAGGLEDHPLFARALVDRAKALSRDPARETVILTAHGTNDDQRNAKWVGLLEAIAAKMRANGGGAFRDIRVATWREDWPDKREPWVARVRGWVEEAGRDGEVIVIPARTNGTGPEARLLAGTRFKLGSGFAPHPLFEKWVQEQIGEALAHRQH